MGSLASRPKVPGTASSPQIVYVPQPSSSSSSSGGTSGGAPVVNGNTAADTGSNAAQTSSDSKQEQRENNLLRRSRGRLSTVLTGFKGILSDTTNSSAVNQRKSLLGE